MNRSRSGISTFGLVILMLTLGAPARCELVTFAFAGTVTNISVSVPPEFHSHDFPQVGDPFTGLYRFDSNAPNTLRSTEQGFFTSVLPDRAVSVSIGPWRLEATATAIETHRDFYGAADWSLITPEVQILGIQLTSDLALGQYLNLNFFSLIVRKDNLLSDPGKLPLTPPSLVGANEASLRMLMADGFSPAIPVVINGQLDTLRLVPEPSSAVLMVIALIWLLQSKCRCASYVKGMYLNPTRTSGRNNGGLRCTGS